ncbi:MAG: adenosine deaminase, partial [Candidatus Marinimicrobia bacterium]|nr:adenosine deaminase [Candidatus Neomarinimicrobiota bacterium]
MKLDLEFFQRLPKAELHCHLDGSLRLDTILDLSEKNKIELPTRDRDTLKKYVTIGDRIGSL